jgi:hypothetical protein
MRRGPRWHRSEGKPVSERKMIMERLLSVAEAADLLGTTALRELSGAVLGS